MMMLRKEKGVYIFHASWVHSEVEQLCYHIDVREGRPWMFLKRDQSFKSQKIYSRESTRGCYINRADSL